MKIALTHLCARLRAMATDEPFAPIVLVIACLGSLYYWPVITAYGRPMGLVSHMFGPTNGTWITLLWIYAWSMLAAMVIPGPAAGGRRVEPLATRPLPSLPIGTRTRVMAEALLPLSLVGVVWLPFLVFGVAPAISVNHFPGGDGFRTAFAAHWLMGALTLLPVLLLFLAPAESTPFYLTRPLVPIALLFLALTLGLLATPLGLVATCLFLTAVSLLLVRWRPSLPAVSAGAIPPPETRYRVGRSPELTLRRDVWARPLPAALVLVVLQIALVGLDQIVALPAYSFCFGSMLLGSFLLSLVAIRPFGVDLIASALAGKAGIRLGDFGRAWSVLPVRREAVARGVYLHGVVTGVAIGAMFLGANLLTTWLKTREPRLLDAARAPGPEFFLPLAAAIPCLAGTLTAGAVGDSVRGIVSRVAIFAVFVGHLTCLILRVAPDVHALLLIAIAATGGLPPLIHLRTPDRAGDT